MLTSHGNRNISGLDGIPSCPMDPFDAGTLTAPEEFSDHTRFESSRGVGLSDFALSPPWLPPSIVLEVTPPDHSRTRRALMQALPPSVVRTLTDQFEADANALIDEVLETREMDAVLAIAEAFPTRVFPAALGLRDADPQKLLDSVALVFDAIGPDNATRKASMAKSPDIVPSINEKCKRTALLPEGFGANLYGLADQGELTEDEAAMLVRSLLSAGLGTTVSGIGTAIWALSQNPGQYAVLVADPAGAALPAFEETLCYTSPLQAFFRTAICPTTVAGIQIEKGTKILCVLGAANLDPQKWDDPHKFDIHRMTIGHIALGAGMQTCVWQTVAGAEGRAVLRALAERVKRIEPLGPAVWPSKQCSSRAQQPPSASPPPLD